MTQAEIRRALENQQQVLVIVWIAFFASILFYLLIPRFVSSPLAGNTFRDLLRQALWVVALMEAGILWWWRGRFLNKEAILEGLAQDGGLSVPSKYTSRKIVAFAIAESIGIYGLILALIAGYLWDQYLLSLISGLLLINMYPARAFFEELVREVEGRSGL